MTALTIPGVTLSQGATAELLYLADVDPSRTDEATAIAAIDRALTAHHDDLDECAADASKLLCDEWANPARWNRCFVYAARLTGVTP
jgi:hypothetical protein